MLVDQLSEDQKATCLSKLGPELRTLLEEKGVSMDAMSALGCWGLSHLATLANMEQEPQHLRELLEKELGHSRNDSFADRAMVS